MPTVQQKQKKLQAQVQADSVAADLLSRHAQNKMRP